MEHNLPESITIIDGNYVIPRRAAAYLIVDGEEAAYFDTVTRFSVPDLLKALSLAGRKPEDVRYIIVSHVHLDHSGGTPELLKHCPNATVICHPRAKRHVVDPAVLVKAARPIYGEDVFESIFGEIEPVDEARVRDVEEGETLELGTRTFDVLHTPGHAKHHMAIYDRATNTVLAGDSFGIAQRKLQENYRVNVSYVASPPDFNSADAKESIRKILATGAERVCITHYGPISDPRTAAERMYAYIDGLDTIIQDILATDLEGDALQAESTRRAEALTLDAVRQTGCDTNDEDIRYWATTELNTTAQGIAFMVQRHRNQT